MCVGVDVRMCYSQGDGFNTSLSRLFYLILLGVLIAKKHLVFFLKRVPDLSDGKSVEPMKFREPVPILLKKKKKKKLATAVSPRNDDQEATFDTPELDGGVRYASSVFCAVL